jgi:hypothetical protein
VPERSQQIAVYQAIQEFKQRSLLSNQSLLWPERTAWTASNVAEVKRRVVDSPETGEGNFESKLLEQLRGAAAEHWIIIADAFYVYYLPSASITLARKQEKIDWARAQAGLPPPTASIWEAQKHGFTNTSQRFNLKYAQIWLVLLLAHHLKQQPNASEILASPQLTQDTLDALLETIPDRLSRATDMRHALLFMLFPQQYERIISTGDKDAIIRTFGSRVGPGLSSDRDTALRAIREALAPGFGATHDYYEDHIKALWRASPAPQPPVTPKPKEPPSRVPPPQVREPDAPEVEQVLEILAHTRNVIFAGPPGTGKTYLAGQVARGLIAPQLQQAAPESARLQRLIEALPFYDVLALALYPGRQARPVSDLLGLPLVVERFRLMPVTHPREAVWNNLQSHTGPESATVKVTRRAEPFLFDKDEQSQWRLTQAGREYVEQNLTAELAQLTNQATGAAIPEDYITWTTFHQSYAYEDFVEGIRPQSNDAGELSYPVVPGALREISVRATASPQERFVLVIDEINRGNIAKVFGELITLLEDDKRGRLAVRLPYSRQSFTVPPNLYVLGTMNTADRSIALLDVALRRRFAFINLAPRPELLAGTTVDLADAGLDLEQFLGGLNRRIRQHLGPDYEIGHSYLLKVKVAPAEQRPALLEFVWNRQILPLLHEYFYSQPEKLREVLLPFALGETNVQPGHVSSSPLLGVAEGDDLLVALQRLGRE